MKIVTQERMHVHHAVSFGRKHQSFHTQLIHYCFESEMSKETIPLFENFCFILALIRSHVLDQVQEGKELLDRLLHFQASSGGFSTYLHEYPNIAKPLSNAAFLIPLAHIHKKYGHILGKELLLRLEKAINFLYQYVKTLDLPPILDFQVKAFETFFWGSKTPEIPNVAITSKDYSDLLMATEMIEETILIPWQEREGVFGGSLINELTLEFQPRTTLIDLCFKPELIINHPIMLIGALLFSCKAIKEIPTDNISYDIQWRHKVGQNFFLTRAESCDPISGKRPPGIHLFRFAFGPHILVCQEPLFGFTSEEKEGEFIFDFTYPTEIADEKGERFELKFFVNHTPPLTIRIADKKANTFQIGEEVTLQNEAGKLSLQFSCLEEDMRLFGHIIRGNRNGQISSKVKTNYEAFDWGIVLRTVHRHAQAKVRLRLRLL